MKFSIKYLIYFLLVFGVETCIALFIHDTFIRPFIGDVLVVVLLYFFVKIFIEKSTYLIVAGVFVFSCFIELLQYLRIVEVLGLEKNRLATVIIGTTFDWMDILAYFTGSVVVLIAQKYFVKGQ